MDLGADPGAYIEYPGGNGFYFSADLEDLLDTRGVEYSSEDLEELFLPFMKPHVRRVLEMVNRRVFQRVVADCREFPELGPRIGVAGWAELGLYVPVSTVAPGEGFLLDAVKLRTLFVSPHAEERRLSFGVNLELSYNAPHWDPSRWSGEARFILAGRLGRLELALNPILDTAFDGLGAMELVPATRLGWRLSDRWTVALEEYASLGRLDAIEPLARQAHTLFAVVDHDGALADVELGIGCGLTDGADRLVLKLILAPEL